MTYRYLTIFLCVLFVSACTSDELITSATQSSFDLQQAQSTVNSLQATATEQQSTLNTQEGLANLYLSQATESKRQLENLRTEISALQALVNCKNVPRLNPSYISNASVSEDLKDWIGDVSGAVRSATWDVIWSNSKTAVHYINTDYLYTFIVFFDESAVGQSAGVFFVDNQCWLDAP